MCCDCDVRGVGQDVRDHGGHGAGQDVRDRGGHGVGQDVRDRGGHGAGQDVRDHGAHDVGQGAHDREVRVSDIHGGCLDIRVFREGLHCALPDHVYRWKHECLKSGSGFHVSTPLSYEGFLSH